MAEGVRTAVIVDDDPDIRRMLKVALEMAGFAVHEAGTGHEGVDMVRQHRPDLITLDLVLPGIGGVEVCRRVRDITDAYIIMITSSSDETDRLVGLATGADDYITKPFNPREVQARVAAMFRRPRTTTYSTDLPVASTIGSAAGPAAQELTRGAGGPGSGPGPGPGTGYGYGTGFSPSAPGQPDAWSGQAGQASQGGVPGQRQPGAGADQVLQHGSLTVDAEGRIARYGPNELPLTKIEFDLLATMMRHPRRAWTRELLLEQVWGSQWSDHHVVEVHIGNLRRKLAAAAPGREIIQTVRGVGYRLAAPA